MLIKKWLQIYKLTSFMIMGLYIGMNFHLTTIQAQELQIRGDQVAATINGTQIKMSEIVLAFQSLPQEQQQRGFQAMYPVLLENVIGFYALIEQGRKSGLAKDPDVLSRVVRAENIAIQQVFASRLVKDGVTDDQVSKAYQEWVSANPPGEERQVSHILLENQADADKAHKRASAGEVFGNLAKELSKDNNKDTGGEIGWIGKGRTVPEFETVAFALKINEVSKPVQSKFGWHVIKLLGIRAERQPSLEEFKSAYLNQQANIIVSAKVKELVGSAKIERMDLAGKPIK